MRRTGTRVACGLIFAMLVVHDGGMAAELGGSARLFYGETESNDVETDVLDQDFNFNLTQRFTPWLSANVYYRFSLDRAATEITNDFERRSAEPQVALTYSRPRVSARLSYADRRIRGSNPTDDLDIRQAIGDLSWRPNRGPSYSLRFRDESNAAADVSIFGRDTDSRQVRFESFYEKQRWSGRYAYETLEIENNISGVQSDENRHELRFNYDDSYYDNRVSFGADLWLRLVDQAELIPSGDTVADPVPARQGLAAIDATPDVGELDPLFALIDGDFENAVSPPIDIGGANTFRNIGVDLGITRPVTRFEITVDTISEAGIIWEVYESTDNQIWTLVTAQPGQFDEALLRYTITFPETVNRYFKAVNTTPNSLTAVGVTEARALLDVEQLGRSDSDSTSYWINLFSTVRPHDKVTGTFNLLLRNDDDTREGRLSRDTEEVAYTALVRYAIGEHLSLRAGYLFSDFEEQRIPVVERRERLWTTGLDWTPLPAVRAALNLQRRDESENLRRIRTVDSVNGRMILQLYENLLLSSDLTYSDVSDPFGGFDQEILTWIENLEGRPTRNLTFGGGWRVSWYDSTGTVVIDRRIALDLFTTWLIVPYLTFRGDWSFGDDDEQQNLSQRYNLSWAPGRRLAVSVFFQDTESDDLRRIQSEGFSATYRFARKLTFFLNFNRSETVDFGAVATEITSGRLGLNLTF